MIKKLILPLLILAASVSAFGQGFGGGQGRGMMGAGGNSPTMMLRRDDVQADLGFTDSQRAKLQEMQEGMRDRFMEAMQSSGMEMSEMRTPEGREKMQKIMKPMMDKIEAETLAVLTPEQQSRLTEIFVQVNGNRSVSNEKIAAQLKVTDAQKESMATLQKKAGEAMMGLFQKMRDGEMTQEEMGEARKKNDEIMNTEIGKILTADQKAMLKKMEGTKKFVPAEG